MQGFVRGTHAHISLLRPGRRINRAGTAPPQHTCGWANKKRKFLCAALPSHQSSSGTGREAPKQIHLSSASSESGRQQRQQQQQQIDTFGQPLSAVAANRHSRPGVSDQFFVTLTILTNLIEETECVPGKLGQQQEAGSCGKTHFFV